jgi:hypothetical protein
VSDTPNNPALQFDRAEFGTAAPAPACRQCARTISDSYYEINGQTFCPECRGQIEESVHVDTGVRGVVRAGGAGVGAGIVGALLYYAVAALSGYEFALIAIVVGYLVGRAVRWGSGNRGGRGYQVLAVAITYVAIVSTYVPFIVEGFKEPQEKKAAAVPGSAATTVADSGRVTDADKPAPAMIALGLAVFIVLVLASPLLAGFQNILGWLIIGFALFEAWKINRPVHLDISGPFTIPPSAPQSAA